ncbi:hypothetical protein ACKLNR_005103 [Fusarium oxysporum f. sp. zingiberi]|uniref:Uncharacterized protein n=1 Tax=Gibberella nygamai TaxID=42673 RepID=A0A2K0WII7_GIBNY|nr:hypothetical protein FNYG_04650 [Fusarium nygamai]
MSSQASKPQFKIVVELSEHHLDVAEAIQTHPDLIREALIQTLILVPLDDSHFARIQVQENFRRSLTAERDLTPYRLISSVKACQEGTIEEESWEKRFYNHGGTKALSGFAAAVADDKSVVSRLEKLSKDDLDGLLNSINKIQRHRDLCYLTDRIGRRKQQAAQSKRSILPRPRRRAKKPTHPPATLSNSGTNLSQTPESRAQCEVNYLDENSPNVHNFLEKSASEQLHLGSQTNTMPIEIDEMMSSANDNLSQFIVPHCYGSLEVDDLSQFTIPHLFGYDPGTEP